MADYVVQGVRGSPLRGIDAPKKEPARCEYIALLERMTARFNAGDLEARPEEWKRRWQAMGADLKDVSFSYTPELGLVMHVGEPIQVGKNIFLAGSSSFRRQEESSFCISEDCSECSPLAAMDAALDAMTKDSYFGGKGCGERLLLGIIEEEGACRFGDCYES